MEEEKGKGKIWVEDWRYKLLYIYYIYIYIYLKATGYIV